MTTWKKKGAANAGGAAATVFPALQPTLYSPYGQWALQFEDATVVRADRSGNARTLGAPAGVASPCPSSRSQPQQSGLSALAMNRPEINLLGDAAPLGELTVTCKMWPRRDDTGVINEQWIVMYAADASASQCIIGLTSGLKMLYVADPSGGVASSLTVAEGQWGWFSLRRAASGDITFGYLRQGDIAPTYETYAIGLPAGTVPNLRIGGKAFTSTDFRPRGSIEDVCMWRTRLTDAEMEPLWQAAMAL